MTATATNVDGLLAALRSRCIELEVHGDHLRYRPRSAMTRALVERVAAHRADILAILRDQAAHKAPEAAPGVPEPPTARAGFVTELVLRDGRWAWRQRRADDADRAYSLYRARRDLTTVRI